MQPNPGTIRNRMVRQRVPRFSEMSRRSGSISNEQLSGCRDRGGDATGAESLVCPSVLFCIPAAQSLRRDTGSARRAHERLVAQIQGCFIMV